MPSEEELREVKRRHSAQLLALPGVCGVGLEKGDDGGLVLAVHLDAADGGAAKKVPTSIEGHPVKLVRSGPFRKQGGL
jgi:hypothetical protein